MSEQKKCHRCGSVNEEIHLWMNRQWCEDCLQKQEEITVEPRVSPTCPLCGEELVATTSYRLLEAGVCMHCLLRLGPDRALLLIKVKQLDPQEVVRAVNFLRGLLNRNQTMRLRETIRQGGRNWWVKLPELGEYACRALSEKGNIDWDNEVLDEVWNRLIEEAVEE